MKLYIDSKNDCFILEAIYFLNVFVDKLLVLSLFRRFKGKFQMTEYTHCALRLVQNFLLLNERCKISLDCLHFVFIVSTLFSMFSVDCLGSKCRVIRLISFFLLFGMFCDCNILVWNSRQFFKYSSLSLAYPLLHQSVQLLLNRLLPMK